MCRPQTASNRLGVLQCHPDPARPSESNLRLLSGILASAAPSTRPHTVSLTSPPLGRPTGRGPGAGVYAWAPVGPRPGGGRAARRPDRVRPQSLNHTPQLPLSSACASPPWPSCGPGPRRLRLGAPSPGTRGTHGGELSDLGEPARERSPPIPPSKENNIYNFSSLREGLSGVNARDPLGEEGSGKIPRAHACAARTRHDARVSRARVTRLLSGARVGALGRGGGV